MLILSEIIIGAFLCLAISQGNPNCPSTEDLQDEYYTVTPAKTNQFVPQDEIDAKAIYDSKENKSTIAGILTYREKIRRYAINMKMATYSTDHKTPWFPETYEVEQNPFDDCCFGLIEEEATVLGNYLQYFMINKDYYRMEIGMVLIKDTHNMITNFDSHHTKKFDSYCTNLKDPYKTLIKNWAKQNREPLEKNELDHSSVKKDADALHAERKNGMWAVTRTKLEYILFTKSIKYARAVIAELEKLNDGETIETLINASDFPDTALGFTYLYFARYIKNKPEFIAEILFEYSDGSDNWAVWIMCMAVIHPKEWPKINEAFQKIKGELDISTRPLTEFITGKEMDKFVAEMMAVIIDPSFKPTQFKPAPGPSSHPS